MWLKACLVFMLFLFGAGMAQGQGFVKQVVPTNHSNEICEIPDDLKKIKAKTLPVNEVLKRYESYFHLQGFLGFYLDSFFLRSDTLYLDFYTGERYRWNKLNMSPEISKILGIRALEGESVNPELLSQWHQKILRFYENHGYPFAQSQLTEINLDSGKISANWIIDKGPHVHIDTIELEGNAKISPSFISNLLGLKPRMSWNEEEVAKIKQRMDNVEFLELSQSPRFAFYEDKVSVKLALRPRKSNTFDAIFGFYTDPNTDKLQFNGNVNLSLQNTLGYGEMLRLQWQRPLSGDQMLDFDYQHPYLLKSSWGIDNAFSLFRRDSSFLNVENATALNYRFSYEDYISLRMEVINSQSTLIESDTSIRDASSLSFGLGLYSDHRNYRYNPSQGYWVDLVSMAGSRKVEAQSAGMQSGFRADFKLFAAYFFGVGKSVFMLRTQSKAMLAKNLNVNELFRIGGLKSLRGFDEQSISTSGFSINTFEYRFLLGKNSHAVAFYDLAFVDKEIRDAFQTSLKQGFGLGARLDSGAGVLSFYLALGKEEGNAIYFRNTKIHFGYLVKF